jgi:hypothetical protein
MQTDPAAEAKRRRIPPTFFSFRAAAMMNICVTPFFETERRNESAEVAPRKISFLTRILHNMTESERKRSRLSRGTGSILLADCSGCCTSETLHSAFSEGIA